MDIARHLITQSVQAGHLSAALDAGIKPDWITDPSAREVWEFLLEFQSRYGKAAGPEALAAEYPNYKLIETPEPVDYVLDRLRHLRKTSLLEMALLRASHAFASLDNEAVERELVGVLREIEAQVPTTVDVDLTVTGAARMARYRKRAERDGGLTGIPTGFDALDHATGGFRPGQLICLVGPPKAGKSTYLQWSSLAAWRAPNRTMFVSFEMTSAELEERLDALEAQVSATGLRDGLLSIPDMQKVERSTRHMELRPQYWLTEDASSTSTVTSLIAKAERLRPQALYVDGVYLMSDDQGEQQGSWQALAHITRSLKQAAKALKIPVIISTQVRLTKMTGGEITAASIGYGPSFAEDCDILLAVQPTKDHDITKMKNLPGRAVGPFEFWMKRDWNSGKMTELTYDPHGEVSDEEDNELVSY